MYLGLAARRMDLLTRPFSFGNRWLMTAPVGPPADSPRTARAFNRGRGPRGAGQVAVHTPGRSVLTRPLLRDEKVNPLCSAVSR